MKDPLTQYALLAPVPRETVGQAVRALPQYQAVAWLLGVLGGWCRAGLAVLRRWLCRLDIRLALWADKLWARFCATPFAHEAADRVHRFGKAVWELPQYQFLRRAHFYFNRHSLVRLTFYCAVASLVALPLCVAYAQPARAEQVYLLVDDDGPRVIVNYPTWEEDTPMLRISPEDTGDAQLILQEGLMVTVRHGDEVITVESWKETVDNLLRRLEITPTAQEMIAINITGDAPLIHISDELRYERTERTVSPYKTVSYANYTLPAGEYEIVQKGEPGYVTDTYEDIYRMGRLVHSLLVDRQDDSAVTQIVEYGKLVYSQPNEARAVSAHPFADGSGGYLVFDDGHSMIYTQEVINNATAYYGGTSTATGHAVGKGVMAVDPKVYSYGTTMYVGKAGSSGLVYGTATAYDCGGAVKGNIIDVWYPTYADCARWGRRNVTCYILKTSP